MNDAIERYRQRVEQDPEDELSRFSLGKALLELGDYAGAREQFSSALTIKPDWMAAHISLARCELCLGNKEAARPVLERARDLARRQGHVGPLAQVEEMLRQLEEKQG
jgi:tetratricopeptide (TPR) repeat protein